MESDTFYVDFMVKLIWRYSGNLIYHVFSMKTLDNLQTNFIINPYKLITLHTVLIQFPSVTDHSGNLAKTHILSPYYGENTFFPLAY